MGQTRHRPIILNHGLFGIYNRKRFAKFYLMTNDNGIDLFFYTSSMHYRGWMGDEENGNIYPKYEHNMFSIFMDTKLLKQRKINYFRKNTRVLHFTYAVVQKNKSKYSHRKIFVYSIFHNFNWIFMFTNYLPSHSSLDIPFIFSTNKNQTFKNGV